MTDEQLAFQLKEAALLTGEFTLRSGRKSNYYLDKYQFETRPTLLRALAERFAKYVTPDVVRLAGPELGGVALATAVSLHTDRPFVLVRNSKKDYGSAKRIEGTLSKGDRVLLTEDIATSGGQAIEALHALRDAGADVAGVVVVIDREEGGREAIEAAGYRFDALFTTTQLDIPR